MRRTGLLAAAVAALLIGGPLPAPASGEWLAVREISLELEPGSPLDFSRLLPNRAIEERTRLIAGASGRLVHADAPETPARMHCASLAWSPASGGFPDHDGAERYARQLAMRGYNIARLHFVDASLMHGRQRDFDFDPQVLDRVHYLLAALKRNGIHWMVDGLSSWRGAYGGHDDRWDPSSDLKLALHLDADALAHWERLQREFLARVNPYTGLAPIEDPALALVILANENGIEFDGIVRDRPGRPAYDAALAAPFNRWLAGRYPSSAALAEAWGGLRRGESLEDGTIRLPQNRYAPSPSMRDLQAFFVETERASAAQMSRTLRELGYRGLISTYNNWPTLQTALSRTGLDAVTMNTYHDWIGTYAPGGRIGQTSSLSDGVDYIRTIAAARWLGKPFVVSEYDHLFWNRHRYEAGLAMPAYAALQGWDVLCRHGHGPIALRYGEPYPHKRAMLPYAIALDPVARAGETLAALIFRRGDVAESGIEIPFAVRGEEDLGENMQAREPEALTQLALTGRIGLLDEAAMEGRIGVTQPRASASAAQILEALRRSGALPPENATDLGAGRHQADTGEILLDRQAGQLRIVTARTQAVAFSSPREPVELGPLRIERAQGDGLVALSALDPETTEGARRFLIIFATDARNTAMSFRDRAEQVIEDYGRLPVLVRKGEVDLAFAAEAAEWRVFPVGLDGTVHPVLASGSGAVSLRLSNDTPAGLTTFFLLELGGR